MTIPIRGAVDRAAATPRYATALGDRAAILCDHAIRSVSWRAAKDGDPLCIDICSFNRIYNLLLYLNNISSYTYVQTVQ
jgi:hypothetical protein